jgi:hypothetical protein
MPLTALELAVKIAELERLRARVEGGHNAHRQRASMRSKSMLTRAAYWSLFTLFACPRALCDMHVNRSSTACNRVRRFRGLLPRIESGGRCQFEGDVRDRLLTCHCGFGKPAGPHNLYAAARRSPIFDAAASGPTSNKAL